MAADSSHIAELRRIAAALPEPPAALDAYLAKVRGRAHTVTDADVAAALAAGLAEDAIFEQTVGAAIGAGLRRWDIARELIGE